MNPLDAIFDKHLEARLVHIEDAYIIYHAPLDNPVAVKPAKGVAISV
jgi:hypothetical protein